MLMIYSSWQHEFPSKILGAFLSCSPSLAIDLCACEHCSTQESELIVMCRKPIRFVQPLLHKLIVMSFENAQEFCMAC